MASLRKRPQPRIMEEAAPVATAAQGAHLPEPSKEESAPPTNPVDEAKENPVEQAAENALKKRIAEMESAENVQREVLTQQERFAKERQQNAAQIPDHIKRWAEEHPHYVHDPIGQAELNVALMKAARGGKTWNDSDFVETVERHLGLRQQPAEKQPATTRYESPARQAAPAPRQAHRGAPVSAPPTRDVPSYSTGRAQTFSSQLTAEEASIARALNLDPEIYKRERERMRRIQASER